MYHLLRSTTQWTIFQFARNIALGQKWYHQGHGQFLIDTYKLEVSNKTEVSNPGSLGPLLLCVNTWYVIIVRDKCCSHLKCLLYVRHILNMAILRYTRCVQKIHGQMLPFLHWLSNRAGITAHNTVTYMQLIGYNMLGVSRLRALQLSSRQRYIA